MAARRPQTSDPWLSHATRHRFRDSKNPYPAAWDSQGSSFNPLFGTVEIMQLLLADLLHVHAETTAPAWPESSHTPQQVYMLTPVWHATSSAQLKVSSSHMMVPSNHPVTRAVILELSRTGLHCTKPAVPLHVPLSSGCGGCQPPKQDRLADPDASRFIPSLPAWWELSCLC